MYKYLLTAAMLLTAFTLSAQNRASVKGRVTDSVSNNPVELATVAIVNMKDTVTSLVSYTITTAKGEFALHNLPAGVPLKVLITFAGYKPYRKFFTLAKGENIDLGTIIMTSKQLSEVLIKGERLPIVIRADTIEFNAEAFKTRPNAVVEDLLKKLPGVEVDNDGTVTVNGKSVSKIMIDGKEFFANDPKIATKNLDASLIDKVQIYDDREDDPDHLIEDSKVNKIINLKFKKALKKSYFGKVYAGAGTQGRFESGGLWNMFRDTLQISLIGVGNNLNKTGFSREELNTQGGFNRAGDAATNNGTTFGGNNYSGGIQTVGTGGFNINNDYGKKLKLNLVYFYTHTQTAGSSLSNNRQFFAADTLTAKSNYQNNNTTNKHNLSFALKWQADTATLIRFTPVLSFDNNHADNASDVDRYSFLIPKISHNTNTSNSMGNNMQYQQSFSYYRRLRVKYESLTISNNINIRPGNTDNYYTNNLTSFTVSQASSFLNRFEDGNSKRSDVSVSVLYRKPLVKKVIGDVSISGAYNAQGSSQYIYDFNPANNQYNILVDSLSTNAMRYQKTEGIKQGFTYNITKKITLIAGLTEEFQQIQNQFNKNIADLNQNYFYLIPNVNLRVGNLSLNYDVGISQPSINDLQPVKLVYSSLYTYTGNPDLKPTRRNNFNVNFYQYNPASQLSINLYGYATIEENSIYRQRTIDNVGAQTSKPINRDGQYNSSMGVGFNKRFKKAHDITFSTNTNLYGNLSHRFFQLNADEGYQNNYYISLRQSFSVNWKDIITLDPSYSATRTITRYTGVNYAGVNYTQHNISSVLTSHLPQKINIEGNYSYIYNPLVSDGFQKSTHLLSMNLSRDFLKKDRGQIRLSCYDILNQNVSSYRYAGDNSVTDVQQQILRRYFMLTLQYKFNKAITAK